MYISRVGIVIVLVTFITMKRIRNEDVNESNIARKWGKLNRIDQLQHRLISRDCDNLKTRNYPLHRAIIKEQKGSPINLHAGWFTGGPSFMFSLWCDVMWCDAMRWWWWQWLVRIHINTMVLTRAVSFFEWSDAEGTACDWLMPLRYKFSLSILILFLNKGIKTTMDWLND